MTSAIQLLCVIGMASGLNAACPTSLPHGPSKQSAVGEKTASELIVHQSMPIKEGQCTFGRDADILLEKQVAQAIAEIKVMTVSKELAYWVKIVDAYKQLDVPELLRLQNKERPKNNLKIQVQTVLFIVSAIDQQDRKSNKKVVTPASPAIALKPMANIKQSSFFKQITTAE